MQIGKIKVCKPIESLVAELSNLGFTLIEKKVSDYHFHEVYIKMEGELENDFDNLNIDLIKKVDDITFSCACHWSTVELVAKEVIGTSKEFDEDFF